jgi:hypothetical protein
MWMGFIVSDFYLGFDGIYEGGGWGECVHLDFKNLKFLEF